MKKIRVAVDADDVLFECNEFALEKLNEEKGTSYTLEEIESWGRTGSGIDERLKYFSDPEFFQEQPLMDGAVQFIEKLCKMVDVFIVTAVSPKCAGVRIQRIIDEFPWIEPGNIIIASRKDLVHVDVMLDDGAHNIMSSKAMYPVLFRRPWNKDVSGLLSVNTYQEFFVLLQRIQKKNELCECEGPKVYAVLGNSGSGKTRIIEEVLRSESFARAKSYTTRDRRLGEAEDAYFWMDKKTFEKKKKEGFFFETTSYGGNYYGTTVEEIRKILDTGRNSIIALDACGCLAVKDFFGERAKIVFIERDKKSSIESILKREGVSIEEKARRIVSIDAELKNEVLADQVILNNGTVADAARQIIQ